MPVVGPVYSYTQIQQLWIQYGGNAQAAPLAAAVAMAESGGGQNSYNGNTNGSMDRGLFQINSVHGSQSTFDIAGNIRAAIAISNNGTTWKPWCTAWTDGCKGTYAPTSPDTPVGKQYAKGGGGSGEVLIPNTVPADTVSTNPFSADFWTHVVDVVGNWAVYISLITAGGLIALVGFIMLTRETAAGRATVGGIRKAATAIPFL